MSRGRPSAIRATPRAALLAALLVGGCAPGAAPAIDASAAADGAAPPTPDATPAADGDAGGVAQDAAPEATAPLPSCAAAGGERCGEAAACAGLPTLGAADCAACCKVPANPVFDAPWADPYVVRVGQTYYTFATGGTVRRRSSTDLVAWSKAETALASAPWKKASAGFWAPAVYRAKNGKWILYYAAERAGSTTQHCIGRAVANAISGTFVDNSASPFLCRTSHWSIDPSVFRDDDGADYLLWRQDTAAMPKGNAFIRRLDDAGKLTGAEHLLVSRATAAPSWEFDAAGGVLENPAMIRLGGKYHLFYSAFRWQTAGYANGHALCDTPLGPCAKTSKAKPWVGSRGDMLGPGGADFVAAADGTRFIYMHGWLAPHVGAPDGARRLWFYRLQVAGDAVSIAPL